MDKKEIIIDILNRNQNEFLGINEANLHSAEDIIEALSPVETQTVDETQLKADNKFNLYDIQSSIAFGFGICRKENRAPFDKEIIDFIKSLKPENCVQPNDELL